MAPSGADLLNNEQQQNSCVKIPRNSFFPTPKSRFWPPVLYRAQISAASGEWSGASDGAPPGGALIVSDRKLVGAQGVGGLQPGGILLLVTCRGPGWT